MRNNYWDSWKGASIVAVVLIHACGTTGGFPPGSFNSDAGILFRQLINFPVGLFIFLAAYFSIQSRHSNSGYISRVSARIWRLALPYLIWSAIYFAARLATGKLSLYEIPLMLANGGSVVVGYYVIVMIQLSFLSPPMERLDSKKLTVIFVASVILSCTFTYGVRLWDESSIWSPFPYNVLPFFVWMPFYVGGLLAAKNYNLWIKSISFNVLVAGFVVSVCVSIIEGMVFLNEVRDLAVSQVKLSSMFATGFLCLIAVKGLNAGRVQGYRSLAWVGLRSYYFYLSHMLFLVVVQGLLRRSAALFENQIAFIFMTAIVTLAICAGGAFVLDRLLSRHEGSRRALGLA